MANVHTLSDLNQGGGGYPGRGGGGGGFPGGGGGYAPMGGGEQQPLDPEAQDAMKMFAFMNGGHGQTKPPREENFWDMWKFTFCSNFTPKALPAVMFYTNTFVYALTIIVSQVDNNYSLNSSVFLGPDVTLLAEWGANDPYKMLRQNQYWRLITPIFLTVGFMQFIFNSACLVLIGFILEATGMSFAQMSAIYFGSAIGGTLFGAVCSSELCVGCDVGYFGFTSALIAAVIVNWKALEMFRLCLLLLMVGIFTMLVLFTVPSTLRTTGYYGWEYYN